MKAAILTVLVLSIGCVTVRPPDIQKTMSDGSIEIVVQKMQRPWRIEEKEAGIESFRLVSNEDYVIGLTLFPVEKLDPFMAAFGALLFFTEKYPDSVLSCEQKVGQPAYTSGKLVIPGKPPVHLELRAWKVAGTETVAVVTGMWPDGADQTWLQDFEAVAAGVRSTSTKK